MRSPRSFKKSFFLATLTIASFVLCSVPLQGWWSKGHVAETQLAFDLMDAFGRNYIGNITKPVYAQLSSDLKESLEKQYPNANEYARMALLPDIWSKKTAKIFFSGLNATLPKELEPYADEPIFPWHFIDTPYPKYKGCAMPTEVNAVEIMTIFEAIKVADLDDATKVALLILFTHIAEDLHQPLHGVSGVEYGCEGDRGGNDICAIYNFLGLCKYNLHSLYDAGMLYNGTFYFDNKAELAEILADLQSDFPMDYFDHEMLTDIDPGSWAAEDEDLADFVYSFLDDSNGTKTKPLSDEYRRKGRMVCKERAALAAYRLSFALKRYFVQQ